VVRRRSVSRYLRSTDEPRLHIGAGPKSIEGWLDTDVLMGEAYVDLSRPLPFEDSTFQFVFGEHVFEQFPVEAGLALLREIRRVLRPGGVLRLTTPELPKLIAIYDDRNPEITLEETEAWLTEITQRPHTTGAQVLNSFMREWGHSYIYDEQDLTSRLNEAGFVGVVRREPGQSDHPALRGVEQHESESRSRAEAMCLEATAG
jgi:predicted SAM-dependent methyltransferase